MSGRELPAGWTEARLSVITSKIGSGATPKGGEKAYKENGTPLIRSLNVHFDGFRYDGLAHLDESQAELLRNVEVQRGDVLLNITGASIGRVTLAPLEMSGARVNQHVCIIRAVSHIEEKYIEKYLSSPGMQSYINGENYGATRQALTKEMIENFDIPLPPFAEQRRIVEKIETLATRSRRAREALNTLPALIDRYRSAILAREIEAATEEADNVPLGNLLSALTSGSRDWAKYYDRGNGVFVLAGNIRPMAFDPAPRRFVDPPRDSADARRSRIEKADLLVTIVGAGTGDVCRVTSAYDDYFVCQSVALLRLERPELSRWVELFLNCQAFGKGQIEKLIYGQGRPHLSFEDIRRIQIKVPKPEAIGSAVNRIEAGLASLDRVHSAYADALLKLATLDQSILAKAFLGELVPQDPNDEPASVLLERIRAERAAAGPAPRRGRRPKVADGG